MMMSQVLHKVDRARTLFAAKEYAQLMDQVSCQLIPPGNPLLYWDRLVIVELVQQRQLQQTARQSVVLAMAEDIEHLCQTLPDRAERFRRRIAEGQRCYVIKDGDRLVARQWVIDDPPFFTTNSGWIFTPPARPALWCHDIFVDAAYRMRGHFVALMQNAQRVGTRDGGVPSLFGEIHFLNQGSIRAHESLGFRIIRTVTLVSCLTMKTYVVDHPDGHREIEHRRLGRIPHL